MCGERIFILLSCARECIFRGAEKEGGKERHKLTTQMTTLSVRLTDRRGISPNQIAIAARNLASNRYGSRNSRVRYAPRLIATSRGTFAVSISDFNARSAVRLAEGLKPTTHTVNSRRHTATCVRVYLRGTQKSIRSACDAVDSVSRECGGSGRVEKRESRRGHKGY